MSEFECADCGELMKSGRCTVCGSTRAGRMDGMSRSEIEDFEKEMRNKHQAEIYNGSSDDEHI